MWTLNNVLDKIERPRRSGIEGALVALMFLTEILSPSFSENAYCGILPWKCSVQASEPSDICRHSRIHELVFAPGTGSKKITVCHNDYSANGQILHMLPSKLTAFRIDDATPADLAWKTITWHGLGDHSLEFVECRNPPTTASHYGFLYDSGSCSRRKIQNVDAERFHCTDAPLCDPRAGHYFDDCIKSEPK